MEVAYSAFRSNFPSPNHAGNRRFQINIRNSVLNFVGSRAIQIAQHDDRELLGREARQPDCPATFVAHYTSTLVFTHCPAKSVTPLGSVCERGFVPKQFASFRSQDSIRVQGGEKCSEVCCGRVETGGGIVSNGERGKSSQQVVPIRDYVPLAFSKSRLLQSSSQLQQPFVVTPF